MLAAAKRDRLRPEPCRPATSRPRSTRSGTEQVDNEMGTVPLRAAVPPRCLRQRRGAADDPGRLLHRRGRTRTPPRVTSSSTATVDVYNQLPEPRQLHRAQQLLALAVEPDDQRHRRQGCYASANFWAVSQAAPMRRVDIKGGNLTLMDYCSDPSFASGGFIADSRNYVHHQRLPAAVADPRQRGRRLVQRRLEPGLLRRGGSPGPVLPRPGRPAAARTRPCPPRT